MVPVDVVAEAGWSECVRTDTQCLPGFGLLVTAGASAATVDVVGSKPGMPRAALWVLVVGTVPVGGGPRLVPPPAHRR
nr:hypothetical protein [Rhodococcus aetherivorans]